MGQAGEKGAAGPAEAKPEKPGEAKAAESGKEKPKGEVPPVLIVPGEDSITIASDDLEALDQLESLLRAMSQRERYAGRNYSFYTVKHISATRAAETLQQLFRSARPSTSEGSRFYSRRDSVVIVPDERLNMILVKASRTDRSTIENLLRVIDTAEVPETLAGRKPRLIAVKNTRASEIESVLRDVFRDQLTASRTTGPGGLAPQLAVDEVTNSLIVMAPSPLIEEITELAKSLDEAAADNPARRVKLIHLEKANATRVQEALQRILRGGSTHTSRYRRSPRE